MSSKRSDHPAVPASGAAPTPAPAPELPRLSARGWWDSFKANAPLPVLLLLLIPLAAWIESRGFSGYHRRVVMLAGFNIILAVSLQLINGFSGQFSLGHAGFMAIGAYLAAYPAREFSRGLNDPAAVLVFFLSLGLVVALVGFLLLGLFLLIRNSTRLHRALPAVLIVLLFAWLLVDFSKGSRYEQTPGWLVWTRGSALIRDLFLWLVEHGRPVGETASGWLPEAARRPLSFLALLVGGGCCAAVVGLIVGMPALRLRGDYLAIATLGFAEIIRIVIMNSPPLGGALGFVEIPKQTDFAWLYGAAIVTVFVIWRLGYSAKGRAIMAVREDEVAAAAVGIDTTHHKVMAFVIGAFFGGVAGALFALHERSIAPSYFGLQKSIEIVVIVTLGGLGSISGAILAAIVLTVLPEALRGVSEYRMIIYSLLLVAMMLLRPQGLLGGRELWPRRWGARRDASPTEDRDDREEVAVEP